MGGCFSCRLHGVLRQAQAANRLAARARAFAASTSRSFGGAAATRSSRQVRRDVRDLVDRAVEHLGVRARGLRRAAHLADVLERRRADLVRGRRRIEVVQRSDVATHAESRNGADFSEFLNDQARPCRPCRPPPSAHEAHDRPRGRRPSQRRGCATGGCAGASSPATLAVFVAVCSSCCCACWPATTRRSPVPRPRATPPRPRGDGPGRAARGAQRGDRAVRQGQAQPPSRRRPRAPREPPATQRAAAARLRRRLKAASKASAAAAASVAATSSTSATAADAQHVVHDVDDLDPELVGHDLARRRPARAARRLERHVHDDRQLRDASATAPVTTSTS